MNDCKPDGKHERLLRLLRDIALMVVRFVNKELGDKANTPVA